MILRDYQIEALDKMTSYFSDGGSDFVLASCPSSGKTAMTLAFIQRHADKNFLIVTHGQNVIKDMWEKSISNTLSKEELKRVTIGIPQSLHRKETYSAYDYIIVDEAHEFTFAEMMKKIFGNNPTAKVIYLTGTPSVFIRKNQEVYTKNTYHIHAIPANELIKKDYLADVYMGIFSTTAQLEDSDYNDNNDLMTSSNFKLEDRKEISNQMADLMNELVNRLGTKIAKSSPNAYKIANLTGLNISGKIGKTLIACQSIKQANIVYKWLIDNKYSALLSNSKNDPESLNIIGDEGFLNTDVTFLVVVDRGILGFNMEELQNVVDMTCSKNLNRTYQLYARAMRKSDKVKDKFFFKLVPRDSMDIHKFYLEAAIGLMFAEFINNYNGKNLNNMQIFAKRSSVNKDEPTTNPGKGKKKVSVTPVDSFLYDMVKACEFMQNLYNNSDDKLNEYAKMTFGDIKREIGDRVQLRFRSLKEANDYFIGNING